MTKSIQRELSANPKKALLLTALVIGAGYFWMPIARRWLGFSAPGDKLATSGPILTDDARPAVSSKATNAKLPPWDLLREAMAKDSNAAPADLGELTRNPFFAAALAIAEPEKEEAPVEAAPEVAIAIDPQKLFEVKSVVLGGTSRFAIVNGDVVRVGDKLAYGQGTTQKEFVITAIDSSGVKLTDGNEKWELLIYQPQLRHRDRIVRGEVQGPKVVTPTRIEKEN